MLKKPNNNKERNKKERKGRKRVRERSMRGVSTFYKIAVTDMQCYRIIIHTRKTRDD